MLRQTNFFVTHDLLTLSLSPVAFMLDPIEIVTYYSHMGSSQKDR